MSENNKDILIIDEQGNNNSSNDDQDHHQYPAPLQQIQEHAKDEEKDVQKIKVKRYDYFNKYTQHQIDEQRYERVTKAIEERKGRWSRIEKMQRDNKQMESSKGSLNINKSISLPKRKEDAKSKSSSNSRSKRKSNNQSAHRLYLQAYQNNIPQPSFSYPLSPTQTRPKPTLVSVSHINHNDNSLEKILTKIPNSSTILSQQILHQNQIFRCQINEYRTMVAKLQFDLGKCREQMLMSQQSFTNQKLCYESIIKQLKDQIIVLRGFRQRYEILNEEMIKINANKLMEEMAETKENRGLFSNYEQEPVANCSREFTKGKIKKVQQKNSEKIMYNTYSLQKSIFQAIECILNGQEYKKSGLRLSGYSEELLEKLEKLIAKNKKHENFIYNIKQMQRKIEKNSQQTDVDLNKTLGEPTVRQLWKWLKILGSNYSFLVQIKPLLGKKLGLAESEHKNKEMKQILQLALINL